MRKITLLFSFILYSLIALGQSTIVFSENFSNVTTTATADANGNIAASKDLAAAGKLDSAIVTNPGWSGIKVYSSNNRLKVGTSSVMGNLTTPAIDLAGKSVVVSVDLASWNNTGNVPDTGSSLDVLLDGVVITTITYTTTMATYTTPIITTGTATSKINFAAKVNKNRFYIDNISVYTPSGVTTPCVDILNVSIAGKMLTVTNSAVSSVEIFNMLGVKVKAIELVNGSAALNLSKGIYIVRAGNKSAKIRL